MSGKNGRKNSIEFKSPAMKKWQRNHLKQENEELANSTSEVVTGFLVPAFTTFCFFMVAGALTADDPWGIVVTFGMTMVFWPVIIIFILYYNSKGNENRKKGATRSFIASLAPIVITIVFGGILQS